MNDIECEINDDLGIETEVSNDSMFIYGTGSEEPIQINYDEWCENEKNMALGSRSANGFAQKYKKYIKELTGLSSKNSDYNLGHYSAEGEICNGINGGVYDVDYVYDRRRNTTYSEWLDTFKCEIRQTEKVRDNDSYYGLTEGEGYHRYRITNISDYAYPRIEKGIIRCFNSSNECIYTEQCKLNPPKSPYYHYLYDTLRVMMDILDEINKDVEPVLVSN